MTPSIDAAKKPAKILDTSVGYLLGENDEANLFKTLKCCNGFKIFQFCPKKKKNVYLLPLTTLLKLLKLV